MLKYITKRILFFIPTLLAISLLTFFISVNAPGDPVEIMLNRAGESGGLRSQNSVDDQDYEVMRNRLGLDQPLFYFSLTDATVSDTLYKIPKIKQRELLKRLSAEYGSWENTSAYYLAIKNLKNKMYTLEKKSDNSAFISKINEVLSELLNIHDQAKIISQLNLFNSLFKLKTQRAPDSSATLNNEIIDKITELRASFYSMVQQKNPYKKYIPLVYWYGFNNQYHNWLVHFFTGDFGISYQDKRPVKTILYGALEKTLSISLLSIILAYAVAIPLGIQSAIKKGTRKEKSITTTLFILYSLPNFWIATVLVVFLCGGDYFSWFPAPGSPPIPGDASFWYKLSEGTYRLILPLFCWTYGSAAFISRQMRGGILSSITQDYIQTARAKGLNEKQVIWKHAMKNSLLPVITLFASVFPLAISGAFIIETIFNIPGMGRLSLEALSSRDYPVIFTVMMFTAILTMLGNLIADFLYALVDPRISYAK